MLDEQSGARGANPVGSLPREYRYQLRGQVPSDQPFDYGDVGGASRFYYCAKASRSEREAGLEGADARLTRRYGEQGQGPLPQQTPRVERPAKNHHPTVKPVSLMRWLVRLVTPKGGTVLDPFTGSGTTGIAATLEGRRFVGIEREAEYVEIARKRIAHAQPSLGVA